MLLPEKQSMKHTYSFDTIERKTVHGQGYDPIPYEAKCRMLFLTFFQPYTHIYITHIPFISSMRYLSLIPQLGHVTRPPAAAVPYTIIPCYVTVYPMQCNAM